VPYRTQSARKTEISTTQVEGRTSWESHKTHTSPHQHQTQTKPTDPYLVGRHVKYRALQRSDPRHHRRRNADAGVIDKHYRDLGKPSGEKHGTYTPSGSPRGLPMGKTREKTAGWRHEPVSSDSDPGFTTQSWISQHTRSGCAEQRKGQTRQTFPTKSSRCSHQSCTSAST
jgi:hypothetical protein